jgi:hypothetical protein
MNTISLVVCLINSFFGILQASFLSTYTCLFFCSACPYTSQGLLSFENGVAGVLLVIASVNVVSIVVVIVNVVVFYYHD